VRRKFRATCCCPNMFCHKMITSGQILMFEVSIEPYWSAQHDWIFENGASAFLVAKIELKDLSISQSFEELLSWNLESKLITPKYITGTYFGAIVAIFNSIFTVCFLGVMLFLTPERVSKAGPATCFIIFLCYCSKILHKKYQIISSSN